MNIPRFAVFLPDRERTVTGVSNRDFVAAGERWVGAVDILDNNAGIPDAFVPMLFRDGGPDHWDELLRLNLYGALNCVKATIDGMCARGWGRIVTISSGAWRMGSTIGISMYASGKAAAIRFTRQLSWEVGASVALRLEQLAAVLLEGRVVGFPAVLTCAVADDQLDQQRHTGR